MTEKITGSAMAVAFMTASLKNIRSIRRVAVAFEFQMLPEVPDRTHGYFAGDHCYRKISLSS